jgi:1,4-dihydroxy-2-naphthoyl-CoA hydrolase
MSIWHGNPRIEDFAHHGRGTLVERLGIVITEIGADFVQGTMPCDERTIQPFRLLHGGASVALAETLGSIGAVLCIDSERLMCLGQEINANHLRAVSAGIVTGTARPFHIGRRSQVWGIEIRDERQRLTCVSRITLSVVERRPQAYSPASTTGVARG